MAIADAPADPTTAISRPDRGEIFLAYRQDLRLVMEPRYPRYGAAGQKVGELPGRAVQFRENRFFCPSEGKVRLDDGREHDAAEVLEWLQSHPMLGNTMDGFWRVEQSAPPVSDDELQALLDAAMRLDVAGLEAIVREERAGWNRSIIVDRGESALEQMRAALSQAQAQQDAEAKSPAAKAKPKAG